MMKKIASASKNDTIRDSLLPKEGAKKGPLYNSILVPFIEKIWNIEDAAKNSTSLAKTLERLKSF